MSTTLTLDALSAVKEKQQATWASGNYATIGTTLQIMGEHLCEAVDVSAGWKVLDVAAGNGNASLAAARRGCDVIATDYVDHLLERAAQRAVAEELPLTTQVADAEDLPYEDGTFDAVLSTVGVMFTPNPERAAGELVRVVRSGGKIGLANWTPEGFVGQMFKIVGQHNPPPAGVPSPLQWGTDDRARGPAGRRLRRGDHPPPLRLPVPLRRGLLRDVQGLLRPDCVKAWENQDDAGKASLRSALVALANEHNRDQHGALTVDSEYVEVVATKR